MRQLAYALPSFPGLDSPKTYATWPVWSDSPDIENVRFHPFSKKKAAKWWHKARRFDRQTHPHGSGRHGGRIGRTALNVYYRRSPPRQGQGPGPRGSDAGGSCQHSHCSAETVRSQRRRGRRGRRMPPSPPPDRPPMEARWTGRRGVDRSHSAWSLILGRGSRHRSSSAYLSGGIEPAAAAIAERHFGRRDRRHEHLDEGVGAVPLDGALTARVDALYPA